MRPGDSSRRFWRFCAIFFLYALSIKVTWNDEVLFTLPMPEFVIHLCNIFRASGRFMWVPMYALMLFAIGIVLRETPPGGGLRCCWSF